MEVQAYLNGILPRSNNTLELGSSWLKGRTSREEFEKVLRKETIGLIELQQNLGFDYIIDGQLFWGDFLRPIAKALELHRPNSNADENPVTRQIYTNTFYRKPLITSRLKNSKEIIDCRFIERIKGKRKIILPSPFAFIYLSDGIHRNENGKIKNEIFKELLVDFARILNFEIKRLEKDCNVSFVQFNEPCLAYAEETDYFWNNITYSLEDATKGIKSVTSLHIHNGDASKFLPKLLELPVERIGVDAYLTNIRKFADVKFTKFLEAGVINSKNSFVEDARVIAKYASQIIERIKPDRLALVPNRPLELVPQQIAVKKIESLAQALKLLK